MNSDVLEKNTYHIIWDIGQWDYFINVYRESKKTVIRSPLFTAECLDHTSWFLTITLSELAEDRFEFSLNRSGDDRGAETVEIDWSIEVTEGDVQVDFRKDKIINIFKKGGSNRWGVSTIIRRHFCIRTLKVTCKMNQCFATDEPILKIAEAHTQKCRELLREDLANEILLYGPQGTSFELSCYATNAAPLIFRIYRSDKQSTLSCYLMIFINISEGNYLRLKSIWSVEVEHMNKPIDIGDIIEKAALESNFVTQESKTTLFADVKCIVTVINKNPLTKTLKIIHENPPVKTSKVLLEKATQTSKIYDDSIPKVNVLACDLSAIYENGMHSDVELQIGSETFKSHKCILSARSPVFSTMFAQEMVEKQKNAVIITDIEVSTLNLLLKFMYTDKIDELDCESSLKLLLAAEKYQVLPLKEMCSTYLMNVLSKENVCEILNIADMVQHDNLKASAMEYVKIHADKVLNSESWKQLVKNNVSVVAETLGKISFDLWSATSKTLEIQS